MNKISDIFTYYYSMESMHLTRVNKSLYQFYQETQKTWCYLKYEGGDEKEPKYRTDKQIRDNVIKCFIQRQQSPPKLR